MSQPHIERRAGVMGGMPVIAGTRVPVSVVLREAANGMTPEEIAEAYPAVSAADVKAAFAWAAEQAARVAAE